MPETQRWARRPEWVHRVLPGRALLARRDGERRTLGGLAVAVWVVLEEPGDLEEIIAELGELAPDGEVSRDDVASALEMLAQYDVITPEP